MNRLSAGWIVLCALLANTGGLAQAADSNATSTGRDFNGWIMNGPAVYATITNTVSETNTRSLRIGVPTNPVFDHFLPGTLNHLIWTNFIAHTNGRSTRVWSARSHPEGWPEKAPIATWATNGLMWGMKGLTALSPSWEGEGSNPGQAPVTALTRRHGYARGHSMGPDGFSTKIAGNRVWFLTLNNKLVQTRVVRNVIRTFPGGANRDYTILLFDQDLPDDIQRMRVVSATTVSKRYPNSPEAPWPIFRTEQGGHVSAGVPGFTLNTWKGGDSGSPDMLPMPGELLFFGGRSTSGPSQEMQADMDELCRLQGLDPRSYQLQWAALSAYP